MVKTLIEQLDEQIEKETDPRKQAELRKQRERLLQAQANEATGDPEEDSLWFRRYRPLKTRHSGSNR